MMPSNSVRNCSIGISLWVPPGISTKRAVDEACARAWAWATGTILSSVP